ncbi:MAG: hypothetical protein ACKODS_01055, partial [Methylophilaceae bacterium]
MTHSEAYTMVLGKRGLMRRKVGNNTYGEILHDGSVGIFLHGTCVVRIHQDGDYTLNAGGWHTVTTKDRINQYSPYRVFQKNHEWFVRVGETTVPFY